ncbi:PilN domain-containing protein [Candidatus Venteria ishoeyi]|uniref:PilN domain-containing protein n=1 Tax=Candidatus Venteria ishoeyi TaxID=1899563 RepID=UPI0025A61CEE|nr:PilN domain-containing protein [Candidatus Venteria ishoeyi]MDM8546828.1 PilN domain-containing protein [Candidatus Venteria ishoeyi]
MMRFSPKTGRKPSHAAPDFCLVLYQDSLIELGTEQHYQLEQPDSAECIAQAARRLLPAADKKRKIALYLPTREFVATHAHLPGVGAEQLPDALQLQLPMLLPGVQQPLLLSLPAMVQEDGEYLALWLAAQRAESLYQAFAKHKLNLLYLLPRPLAAIPHDSAQKQDTQWIHDEDAQLITRLLWQNDGLNKWLPIWRQDYVQAPLREQFEHEFEPLPETTHWNMLQHQEDWIKRTPPDASVYAYAIIPPAAKQQQQQNRQRRQRWAVLTMLALLLTGALAGGGWLAWEQHKTKAYLAQLQQQTRETRRLRNAVFTIEEDLGPILNFPEQNVIILLQKLNGLIPTDSWLNRFKIEGGVIELEGYSPHPTDLLEAFTNDPLFEDVAFNRPTSTRSNTGNAEQFGIEIHLKDIDVKAYLEQYFPHEDE